MVLVQDFELIAHLPAFAAGLNGVLGYEIFQMQVHCLWCQVEFFGHRFHGVWDTPEDLAKQLLADFGGTLCHNLDLQIKFLQRNLD